MQAAYKAEESVLRRGEFSHGSNWSNEREMRLWMAGMGGRKDGRLRCPEQGWLMDKPTLGGVTSKSIGKKREGRMPERRAGQGAIRHDRQGRDIPFAQAAGRRLRCRQPLVRVIGLEPILLSERTPKARASTNSATPALVISITLQMDSANRYCRVTAIFSPHLSMRTALFPSSALTSAR